MKKQIGFSLVELLVGLALSSILATAIYKIVQNNQQGIRLSNDFVKMQEAARTVFDILQVDLRMAGYLGCAIGEGRDYSAKAPINVLLDENSTNYQPFIHKFVHRVGSDVELQTIEIISGDSVAGNEKLAVLGKDINDENIRPHTGSDIIVLRKAIPSDLQLGKEHLTSANTMELVGPDGQLGQLVPGKVMLVSDCQGSDIFVASAVSNNRISHTTDEVGGLKNVANALSQPYQANSQLMHLNTSLFFVAKSQVLKSTNPNEEVRSLYRYDSMSGKSREMVPYVESMKIELHIDTDNDSSSDGFGIPDTWRSANILELQNVSETAYSARVTLVLSTAEGCSSNDFRCLQDKTFKRVIYFRNSGRFGL